MTDQPFTDHVALVTGAASGIGAATVQRFEALGAHVLAFDVDEAALSKAWPASDDIEPVAGSVVIEADLEAAVQRAVERWDRLDLVTNIAGIFGTNPPIDEVTQEAVERIFAINTIGPALVIKHALKQLRNARGAVVNVTSIVADRPATKNSPYYAASKAALAQLTRCWAIELASDGIRVNAVAPGPTDTPMFERAGLSEQAIEKIRAQTEGRIPLGRRGRTDDLTTWIVRLADRDSFVTGQTVTVDGGLSLV